MSNGSASLSLSPAGMKWYSIAFKLKRWGTLGFAHAICLSVAVTCLFPLWWMILSSLRTQQTVFTDTRLYPTEFNWMNYAEAWTRGNFGTYFFNSLLYTALVVIGVILIASPAAYAFSRFRFPGRRVLFLLLISTMMVPIPGAIIAIYVLLNKLGLVNTRLGYILPQINAGLAFAIFMLKTFFDKLPKDLEDAAKMDGCNKLQIYWNVAMPLAKPAIAVIAIFNALAVWNEYILAMLVLSDRSLMPLQRGLMVFQGSHVTEYPLLMAGITLTVIPIVILYLIMQRNIVAGITAGSIKL